ncbi:hypothetical protein [Pedobacter terrae]|uniref:hypothetical protein n=1 Tax=Pedobacter terrae TaxID=405671 RepID=UPI00115FEDEC|nr:hypothetical protein [Pedobacter terrae]
MQKRSNLVNEVKKYFQVDHTTANAYDGGFALTYSQMAMQKFFHLATSAIGRPISYPEAQWPKHQNT